MSTRPRTLISGGLIALAIATFAYGDITTTRRADPSVAKAGGVSIPGIVGAIVLVGGIALQLSERKRSGSDLS
jgi:hypothetical protein